MNLTEHFTLEELIASEVAERARVDNTPAPTIVENLKILAARLETVRYILDGKPVIVRSGYRCERLNQMVGGSSDSAHMKGLAADIICPQFGAPIDVCRRIAGYSGFIFDQCIYEGTWCHIGFSLTKHRNEVLTAHFGPGGATYQIGLAALDTI